MIPDPSPVEESKKDTKVIIVIPRVTCYDGGNSEKWTLT